MNGYGQAHGKIILMGEHSVVYGFPAIALPFEDATIKTEVSFRDGEIWLESAFYTGEIKNAPHERDHLVCAINSTLDYLKEQKKNLMIKITSDLPASRGLGSSAAVAVAIIRGLFHYFKRDITEEELIYLAHEAEKIAHGNPSGIDVITTAFEQPIWFRKVVEKEGTKEIKPISIELPAYLVVADTEIFGQTKEAVQIIADKLKNNPELTKQLLDQLGGFAVDAETQIQLIKPKKLGELMTQAHRHLDELGVSHPTLNHLVEKAMEYGAYGAKLTGGGLGGCMICLVDSYEKAQLIAENLKQEGAKETWIYPLSKR